MRRISLMAVMFFIVLAAAYFGGAHNSVAAQQKTPEQQLIQLEHDWCTALVKRDGAFLGGILADDFVGVSASGTLETKASELASLNDKSNSMTACTNSNMKVRVYGNAAVVTGMATQSGANKAGAYKDRQILWIDTFIKTNGRWLCVASQSTRIAAQQNK